MATDIILFNRPVMKMDKERMNIFKGIQICLAKPTITPIKSITDNK